MEYNQPMSAKKATSKQCNADRNQRKYCIYFHPKTGVCTKPADGGDWQTRAADAAAPK
jgi:hypothetical protein